MRNAILIVSAAAFMAINVEAQESESLELPNIFERENLKHCEDNGVVQSWCDSSMNPELECVMLPGFDQYGCSCHSHPYLCPTDCVGGKQADQKMHYGIQCLGIPQDEPNYVLYEVSRIVLWFSILWNSGYGRPHLANSFNSLLRIFLLLDPRTKSLREQCPRFQLVRRLYE
jgi:hypothetical protein